jgi:hypothetical protein
MFAVLLGDGKSAGPTHLQMPVAPPCQPIRSLGLAAGGRSEYEEALGRRTVASSSLRVITWGGSERGSMCVFGIV